MPKRKGVLTTHVKGKRRRRTNPGRPEQGHLGSTEPVVPVRADDSDTDSEQSLVIVPQQIVEHITGQVDSLGHGVGNTAWLNDPTINFGAGGSSAVFSLDAPANVHQDDSMQLQQSPNVVAQSTNSMPEEGVFVRPKIIRRKRNWTHKKRRHTSNEGGANEIQPVLAISETNGEDAIHQAPESNADPVEIRNFVYPPAWCGIDEISADIFAHSCGEFHLICIHCNALYFRGELNSRKQYVHCCNSGKVSVPPLGPYPTLLCDLMEGRHANSANFLRYIRKYNNMLSFTSVDVSTERPSGRGPYVYRIHGRMYHRISNSMRPPGDIRPRYAQLYVYDAEEALRERMNVDVNSDLNDGLLLQLDQLIRDINPFARSFKLMRQVEQEVLAQDGPDAVKNIRMWFTNSRPTSGVHQGRLNAPVATDVAMIYRSETGAPPIGSFCIFPVGSGLRELSRENPHCDPLTYTIFFPNGESGWDRNLNYTLLKFYSYRFSVRENDSNVILRGRRLLQQYIVDAYCAVEANRLSYIGLNQERMRVDSYRGLMDHIANMSIQTGIQAGLPVILPSTFIGSARHMQ